MRKLKVYYYAQTLDAGSPQRQDVYFMLVAHSREEAVRLLRKIDLVERYAGKGWIRDRTSETIKNPEEYQFGLIVMRDWTSHGIIKTFDVKN